MAGIEQPLSHRGPSDRYIPYRPYLDVDEANFKIRTHMPPTGEKEPVQYKDSRPILVSKFLNGGKLPSEGRILPVTVSSAKKGKENAFSPCVTYSKQEKRRNSRRHTIPKSPDSVMDMPGLRDDFYTNLLDWGSNNLIAVALHQSTYVWDAVSKECQMIKIYSPEVNERAEYFITSLRWKREENLLAIGDTEGDITALAWCPWRREVIGSGGGSSDGYIRLWNSNNGEKVGEAFTQSQVCSLHWSNEYQELVSSHGTAIPEKNDIVVWDMKQLGFDPLACLRQHVARPLHLAMSPNQTTIASAGADEALCIWKLFPKKISKARTKWDSSPLNLFRSIR